TFGALEATVRTGRTAFTEVTGSAFFDHFAADDVYARRYHAAMRAGSQMLAPLVVHGYTWDKAATIVDVGGGDGTTLAAVLAAHPTARGTLFDT
ncbi:hypothetical protein G3I76_32490, partial [Streptomyces sp. SID11233]|nr:hypothetical protein [Streptomyces sp. SID11233]